jgi:hypothetical protein
MKNIYKLIASLFLLAPLAVSAQTPYTAIYNFASVTTTSGTTDPTPLPVVANMVFDSVEAVGVLSTNSSGGGRFSFTGFPAGATNAVHPYDSLTGSIDPNIYYEVTIGAEAGYLFSVDTIEVRLQRSSTAARTFVMRSSLDNYTSNIPAVITNGNVNLSVQGNGDVIFYNRDSVSIGGQNGAAFVPGATYDNLIGDVTFRIYPYNTEAPTGTSSIDDLTFIGDVMPDPTSVSEVAVGKVNMFPNPSVNGIVTLDLGKNVTANVTVFNVIGNAVLTKSVNESSRCQLDLSHVAPGTYFVQVLSAQGSLVTKKLTVK